MIVQISKALSNEDRFTMLEWLREKNEISVSEFQSKLWLEQSTVSHHLGVLKKAGLIIDRIDGRFRQYRLTDDFEEIMNQIKLIFGD
jgi:ArsR family transcriptional regulator